MSTGPFSGLFELINLAAGDLVLCARIGVLFSFPLLTLYFVWLCLSFVVVPDNVTTIIKYLYLCILYDFVY